MDVLIFDGLEQRCIEQATQPFSGVVCGAVNGCLNRSVVRGFRSETHSPGVAKHNAVILCDQQLMSSCRAELRKPRYAPAPRCTVPGRMLRANSPHGGCRPR